MEVAYSRASNRAKALKSDIESDPKFEWARGDLFVGRLIAKMSRLERKLEKVSDLKKVLVDGATLSDEQLGNPANTASAMDDVSTAIEDLLAETVRLRTIQDESEGDAQPSQ